MANIQLKLIVISGQENDGPFFIDPRVDSLTIGQSPDNQICLSGPDVSPSHCRLFQQDGRWFVEDLGSASGTRINGTPVTGAAEIDDVDKLELGSYTLQFLLEEPPEPPRPTRPRRPRSNVLQVPAHPPPPAQGEAVGAQPPPWPHAAPAGGPMPPPPSGTPVGMGPGPQAPVMAPPSAPLPPVGGPPGSGMVPPPPPPGTGSPAAVSPSGGGGKKSTSAPASKICKCGLLLMGDAGGFSCPVCKRRYDKAGKEIGAKASAGGGRRSAGSFLTGRTGLMVVGGVVVLAVLVVVGVIVFSEGPPPAPPNGPKVPPKREKLPKSTSDTLNVVVSSAIALAAMDELVDTKPDEMTLKAGRELSVKIEGRSRSHPLLVVKDLKVKLAWTDVVAKVTSDLTGLSLKAIRKIPVGPTGSFEQDDVLAREADGWYITRAKK